MTAERITTEDFASDLDALGIPEHQHAAFLAYVSNVYGDPDRVLREDNPGHPEAVEFEEAYCGEWDSERDYAESEDGGACGLFDGLDPDRIEVRYFDWEGWTRDLFISDYWSAPSAGYGVYVFRNI